MKKLQAKILILAAILIFASIVAFVFNNIIAVSNMLANFNPLIGRISLFFMLGLMFLCCFYLIGIYFMRQKPLIAPNDPTPEQEELYLENLLQRLNSNKQLRDRGLRANSDIDVVNLIATLDNLAEEEIKQVAKRVFVSTSISQNGRLDSIIVFYQIAILIWRVSKIYGQSPYPYELWKIYCNVLTTSMISYGIEQVDLTDQIGSLISPLVANSVVDHIPVLKTFTKVFTHAIVSGSANAGLVCRVGVVAKNYMGLKTLADHSIKQRPTVEATRMLNSISSQSVHRVLSALAGSIKDITAQGAMKATDTILNTAGVAVQGVANVGRTVGESTLELGGSIKDITAQGAKRVTDTIVNAAGAAVHGVADVGRAVGESTAPWTKKAADTFVNIAGSAVEGIGGAGRIVGENTLQADGATKGWLKKASAYAVEKAEMVGSTVKNISAQRAKKAADTLAVETTQLGFKRDKKIREKSRFNFFKKKAVKREGSYEKIDHIAGLPGKPRGYSEKL